MMVRQNPVSEELTT